MTRLPLLARSLMVLAISAVALAWSPPESAGACFGQSCPCEIDWMYEVLDIPDTCMPDDWEYYCYEALEEEWGFHLAQNCEPQLDSCGQIGDDGPVSIWCSVESGPQE